MSSETTNERVCQRGVDGSAGCGHSVGTDRDGRCVHLPPDVNAAYGERWVESPYCDHFCDFEFSFEDETREFDLGSDPDFSCNHIRRADPIRKALEEAKHTLGKGERQSFYVVSDVWMGRALHWCKTAEEAAQNQYLEMQQEHPDAQPEQFRAWPAETFPDHLEFEEAFEWIGQQKEDAPVHKASPQFGSAAGKIETTENFDAPMELVDSVHKVSESNAIGDYLDEVLSRPSKPCDGSCQGFCDEHAAPEPVEPPPARVWPANRVYLPEGVIGLAAVSPELENGEGDWWLRESAHLEPIQRAINECVAASSTKDGVVYVSERVWERLVALIGEK